MQSQSRPAFPQPKPPTHLNNAYVQLSDQLMSTSHEIRRSVTQANESAAYAATSGLSWRSWAEVSGWIMMMVIRRDPEKPIDLSSIPVGKNVTLMWRFVAPAHAHAAPAGRAI